MVKVVITGIGLISALGNSLEDSWQNLLTLKTGIKLSQPFPELGTIPVGLIAQQPSDLSNLTQRVVHDALQDAELVAPLPDCAVVIGSSRGYQASWEQFAKQMYAEDANPGSSGLKNWLERLPLMNAIAVARQIGACGTVLAPMAACSTGIWAISQAAMLIQTGQYQRAIAGAVSTCFC